MKMKNQIMARITVNMLILESSLIVMNLIQIKKSKINSKNQKKHHIEDVKEDGNEKRKTMFHYFLGKTHKSKNTKLKKKKKLIRLLRNKKPKKPKKWDMDTRNTKGEIKEKRYEQSKDRKFYHQGHY